MHSLILPVHITCLQAIPSLEPLPQKVLRYDHSKSSSSLQPANVYLIDTDEKYDIAKTFFKTYEKYKFCNSDLDYCMRIAKVTLEERLKYGDFSNK